MPYDIGYVDADGSFKIILARGAQLPATGFFAIESEQSQRSEKKSKRIIFADGGGQKQNSRRPLGIVASRVEAGRGGVDRSATVTTRIVVRVDDAESVSMEAAASDNNSPVEIHVFDKPPGTEQLRRIARAALTRKAMLLPYARGIRDDAVIRARQLVMRLGGAGYSIGAQPGDQANRREAYVRLLYLDLALDFLESSLDKASVDRSKPAPPPRFPPLESDLAYFLAAYFVGDGELPELPTDPSGGSVEETETRASDPHRPKSPTRARRWGRVVALFVFVAVIAVPIEFRSLRSELNDSRPDRQVVTVQEPVKTPDRIQPSSTANDAGPSPATSAPLPAVVSSAPASPVPVPAPAPSAAASLLPAAPAPPRLLEETAKAPAPIEQPPKRETRIDPAQAAFDRARAAATLTAWDEFLGAFEVGVFADRAREERRKLATISMPIPSPPSSPKPADSFEIQLYTPWTKSCLKGAKAVPLGVCITTRDARNKSGASVVAAALIEPKGQQKKILRVTLPLGMRLAYGSRVIIDKNVPLRAPYRICSANGCTSDYEANADMIGKMKTGQSLLVEGINFTGKPISVALALTDFGRTFDGPPAGSSVSANQQARPPDELQRRAAELRKRPANQQVTQPQASGQQPVKRP